MDDTIAGKFATLTTEPDTHIHYRLPIQLEGYDVLLERWSWEGISASSLIFVTAELAASDEASMKMHVVRAGLAPAEEPMTIKHTQQGFSIVSFNFE